MDAYSEAKSMRLLTMYSRLLDGKSLKKRELAEEFGIAERSVQRDMESLRIFFAEEMLGKILGSGTELLDGGEGVARQTKRRLEAAGLLEEGTGELVIENSLPGPKMIELSRRLLAK